MARKRRSRRGQTPGHGSAWDITGMPADPADPLLHTALIHQALERYGLRAAAAELYRKHGRGALVLDLDHVIEHGRVKAIPEDSMIPMDYLGPEQLGSAPDHDQLVTMIRDYDPTREMIFVCAWSGGWRAHLVDLDTKAA